MSTSGNEFSFGDGVLHIRSRQGEMRMRWRPSPSAEELPVNARRWQAFWPEIRLLRAVPTGGSVQPVTGAPEDRAAAQKAVAFAAFREELPPAMATVVEPFVSHQWALMLLLHEDPSAMDLATGNPVLAYCLANSDQFRGTHAAAAAVQSVWYSGRRQRAILEWLGFPGTESMARMMRKIPPGDASLFLLRCLRNALVSDPELMAVLGHLGRINSAAMDLVANGRLRPLVTPRLLHEVSEQDLDNGEPSCGDLILNSLTMLREFQPRRSIGPFSSIEQIRRCHEATEAEYRLHRLRIEQEEPAGPAGRVARGQRRRRRAVRQPPSPLPAPPIPGTDDIVPITTVAELVAEGREQCNCVASYERWIRQGTLYVYRVLAPERATVSLVRGFDGCWRRSELRAKNNRKVHAGTTVCVNAWVARYRASV